jgi:Flp pilus assembly pilin Flp
LAVPAHERMVSSGLVYASLASHVDGAINRKHPPRNRQPAKARKGVNELLNLIQTLVARLKREEGQTIVEYGLVIGGVSLVLIGLLVTTGLGPAFTDLVNNVIDAMNP